MAGRDNLVDMYGLRLWTTSSRSNFNKSWQCPKNISIIKGATTKQKGQVNIGATGRRLPAHLAHLHKQPVGAATAVGTVAGAAAGANLCRQQAIKQLGYGYTHYRAPQNDLNTHNLAVAGDLG